MKWEYKFEKMYLGGGESSKLEVHGLKGWELVSVHPDPREPGPDDTVLCYFKRPLYGPGRVGLPCPECSDGIITEEQTCTACPLY